MRRSTGLILFLFLVWVAASIWIGGRLYDAVRSDGAIEVRVWGDDVRVAVDLPAYFVVRALRHANWATDDRRVIGHRDVEEWAPALRAALTELEAYDEVPLLEIEDDGSLVTIHKRRGRFVLEVEDGRDRVKVVMPANVVRRALTEAGV